MSRRTRRNHSPAFKAKVAPAAIRGEQTLAELAQKGRVVVAQEDARPRVPLECQPSGQAVWEQSGQRLFVQEVGGHQASPSLGNGPHVCPNGAWRDNVFVERLWRTIKYEEVYLRAYRSVSEARRGLRRYLAFYNRQRPHSALGGQTPDQAYFNQPEPTQAAA